MSESLLERAIKKHGVDKIYAELTPEQLFALKHDWKSWARPEQLPPDGDWLVWLMLAGRGGGKTRAGAEWAIAFARDVPGCRIAIIGRTAADVRTTMLEGESGILSISSPNFFPIHEPSKCKLTWPNGSVALTFSAEEPRGLRGPQFHGAWCDELAAWQILKDEEGEPDIPQAWSMLEFGMRLPGTRPRVVVTTTPRATKVIHQLARDKDCRITRWSTFDNKSNLAPKYLERMKRFEGTRLGRQELHAEILETLEGALWTKDLIHRHRTSPERIASLQYQRIVVAVDPSGSAKKSADETGIVVVGLAECPLCNTSDLHAFVIEDLSGKYSPETMGRIATSAYHKHRANSIVAEDNFGGQIIKDLIALIDPAVPYQAVHATRGKIVRAEPVAAQYERGVVHHIGEFLELEEELCTYTVTSTSSKSPGRMDALVWAVTELMLHEPTPYKAEAEAPSDALRRFADESVQQDYDEDFGGAAASSGKRRW